MTKSEYVAIRKLYVKLMEKGENRTELEDARYRYADALINYVNVRATAIQCGNKHPDDNFLVKEAKARTEDAQKRLRELEERLLSAKTLFLNDGEQNLKGE